MDTENRNMEYLTMRSLQERPITLGELLLREENIDATETAPPRPMGRTMSPTRCLGPLAIGRPRRARGRTMTRTSTAVNEYEDGPSEWHSSQTSQLRRRRTPSGSLTIPALARWRVATADARIRNFHSLLNRPQVIQGQGTSAATRSRHRSLDRSESPDLFFNPFSWQRRRGVSAGGRRTRSRSATNSGSRRILHRRSQRSRPTIARTSPGVSRMIDLYDSREEYRGSSYRCLRSGRPHSGRPDPETRRSNANGSSDIPDSVRRFIDFAAEFIPVEEQPPDAEPPEWSLNITAADFGPFAIGRSALSRARSLAIMGVLSQVNDNPTDAQPRPNEN